MRHWHGCSIEEIAEALNSSSGADKEYGFSGSAEIAKCSGARW